MRAEGRKADEMRRVTIEPGVSEHAEGSALIEIGRTRVLCTASIEERVPAHRLGKGGWVTAEYGMLPRSTHARSPRPGARPPGRSMEIQRLIGRSLRAAVDLGRLGTRTFIIDCDVLQADGGTRAASVTGGYVALALAVERLRAAGSLQASPLLRRVAATSVGIVDGAVLLDLCYEEDQAADVDLNLVATGDGRLIEVQGTAEADPFERPRLDALLDLGLKGIALLVRAEEQAIAAATGSAR